MLEAARSQIAGTVSQAEVQSLPLNGRNFLELALLVPGVSPTNVASTQLFPETSAVPGVSLSVGSQRNLSNNFIVDGLSANDDAAALSGITYGVDAVEQFQVVTSGGQAELGRALGGYVNVVTKSGTNVLHGTVYDYFRDDRLNARNALAGDEAADEPVAVRGQPGRTDRRRIGRSTSRTSSSAGSTSRASSRSRPSNVARHQRAPGRGRLSGAARRDGRVPESGRFDERARQGRSPGERPGSVQRPLQPLRRQRRRTRAAPAALNAPSASSGLDNLDQTIAVSNTLTLSPRTVLETRAQFAHGDLKAPPTDPIGPAVSIAGVASFGTQLGQPDAPREQDVSGRQQPVAPGRAPTRSGSASTSSTTTTGSPIRASVRGSYTFSSLANFLAGVYNNAGFTQTFGASEVSQTNPNVGVYVQDEWKVGSRVTLNLGLRYDLQFLETIDTDTNNVSPRVGVAWSPFDSRRTVVRGSAGLFYDRVPLRALANAMLSAGNTTDLANLRQIGVSLSPDAGRRAGVPEHPQRHRPVGHAANLTTMDRDLQNAYSRQASVEVEQQLGERATVSVGYQYLRGLNLLMSVNQNVPTCVAVGHQQRLPAESGLREQQPVLVGRRVRTITACTSRSCSGRRAGATTGSRTRCRSR